MAAAARPQTRPPKGSRVRHAYEVLRARIQENVYPPGFEALEQTLANELGVSRTPVREALIQLAQEGLVDVRPRHGMRVRGLSATDMNEIYELIASAEMLAVEKLADPSRPSEAIDALEEQVSLMETALARDDLDEWAVADSRFHELLFERCGNARLAKVGLDHLSLCRRARLFTLRLRNPPARSTRDHRDLIGHLRGHDAAAARDLTRAHRDRARLELVALIEQNQLGEI